ncbi:MAG: DUF2723 domain-containing protein [Planctomycetes bacterium]|nr:DUF2723 domain-containing protein [Planctomycetota bacterium]
MQPGARSLIPAEASPRAAPGFAPGARRAAPFLTLFLAALGLYAFTLAPGIQWGDSARQVLLAVDGARTGGFHTAAGHHLPLNLLGAAAMRLFPEKEPALIHALLVALLGAGAVAFSAAAAARATHSTAAGVAAGVTLGAAHVWWHQAVVSEHYPLFNFLFAILLHRLFTWRETRSPAAAAQAAAVAGLMLATNLLIVFFAPGIAWFLRRERAAVTPRTVARAGLCFLLGWSPTLIVFALELRHAPAAALLTERAEARFHHYLFFLAPAAGVARGLGVAAGYLCYQLPLAAVVMVVVGVRWWGARATNGRGLLFWCAGIVCLLASTYMPQRAAQMLSAALLPLGLLAAGGYAALAGFAAREIGARTRPRPRRLAGSIVVLLALVSGSLGAGMYHFAPAVAGWANATISEGPIPHRRDLAYFLEPSKRGMDGASRFAREGLALAAPDGVVLADFTVMQPVLYHRDVLGDGAGVLLEAVEAVEYQRDPVGFVRARLAAGRRVFLARRHDIYRRSVLEATLEVTPAGPWWQVAERPALR